MLAEADRLAMRAARGENLGKGSRARVEVVCVCVSRAAWEALLEAVTAEETPLLVVMDLDRSRL